jgi:hypothetical protein
VEIEGIWRVRIMLRKSDGGEKLCASWKGEQ